ncbi:MAG: GxxExxY protein [Phycisphaerales bacterium]|jgi:GxxExxY protein|nr:GxxExxY protein [Phycisphaerales bacterium]
MSAGTDSTDRQSISEELNDVSGEIIGAAIEVHRHLGPGLLENIYERALVHELCLRGMTVQQQVPVSIAYKDLDIAGQRLDLIVEPGIVVELKAVEVVKKVHEAQLLGYLKSTGLRLGLLINFNNMVLTKGIKRIIN